MLLHFVFFICGFSLLRRSSLLPLTAIKLRFHLELFRYQYWKMLLILLKMLVQVSLSTLEVKKRYPATSQLAQIAVIDITYLKSVFVLPLLNNTQDVGLSCCGNYFFKSVKEERRELTELAKYLHSAIFYTGKSKEMYQESFYMSWCWIATRYLPVHKFGYWNQYQE